MHDKLKKIIWQYFDTVIPNKGWQWVSLSFDSDIHFLFVDKSKTILTARPAKYFDFEDYRIGEYYVYESGLLNDIVYMFGNENHDISKKLFIKWIEKNIPLDVTKTDAIGGKKRIVCTIN